MSIICNRLIIFFHVKYMLQILLDLVCQLLKEECWSFNYNHRFYYLFIQFYIIYLSLFLDSWSEVKWKLCLTQSDTVVSDSLWSLGLYVQWNSLQQNTGGGSLSHLQGIFPTQGFSDVYTLVLGFPGGSGVKNPPANAGDEGLIPRSGRPLEEGNGNPLLQ